jgi:hypothetical protein
MKASVRVSICGLKSKLPYNDSFYTYSDRIPYTSNKYQSLHTFHSLAHHQFFHRFPEYPGKRSSHSSHKTQPLKSTANAMKASIRVSICGLKSKLPYINSFVENAKSEEKKYLTHIQKTQTEMRTAAANIKDVLCKSVWHIGILHALQYKIYSFLCSSQLLSGLLIHFSTFALCSSIV